MPTCPGWAKVGDQDVLYADEACDVREAEIFKDDRVRIERSLKMCEITFFTKTLITKICRTV